MHIFDYRFLKDFTVSMGVLNRVSKLEGFNQKCKVLGMERQSILESMERIAIVLSTRDSNAIEGIGTMAERMVPLIVGDTKPIGHSESEILGYGDCLRHIHQNYADLVLSTETILKLYGILMSYTDVDPVFKTRDNDIIDRSPQGEILKVHRTVPYRHVEEAMDDMIASYWEARNDTDINNLLLIPCFIVDFLRIHPFIDGNGRMSRLLTTLLLYQEGYDICRYVSLESKIRSNLKGYYDALESSEEGWFDNRSSYEPFIDYFLGVLFLSYREYDRRLAHEFQNKGKSGAVRDLVLNMNMPVSKKDLISMLLGISEATISSELKRLLDAGEIVKIGSTRSARYISADRR